MYMCSGQGFPASLAGLQSDFRHVMPAWTAWCNLAWTRSRASCDACWARAIVMTEKLWLAQADYRQFIKKLTASAVKREQRLARNGIDHELLKTNRLDHARYS